MKRLHLVPNRSFNEGTEEAAAERFADDTPLTDVPLPQFIKGYLEVEADVYTVGQLRQMKDEDILRTIGLGPTSLKAINKFFGRPQKPPQNELIDKLRKTIAATKRTLGDLEIKISMLNIEKRQAQERLDLLRRQIEEVEPS